MILLVERTIFIFVDRKLIKFVTQFLKYGIFVDVALNFELTIL